MTRLLLVAGWRSVSGGRRGSRLLRSWRSSVVVAVAVLVVAAGSARAQVAEVPTVGWTAGGLGSDVTTLAVGAGNKLYLGGRFSSLGMRTGHWVRFDAGGRRDPAWPEVDGSVSAAVPDGAGGWFIGGQFSLVAGQRRAGLAHVGPGGELDPVWSPDLSGFHGPDFVTALCVIGDTVYVAGAFERIDGQRRDGFAELAAVDAVSGRVRAWAPHMDGVAHALAAASGKLYVGGEFTRVGSARRRYLAAFDAAT